MVNTIVSVVIEAAMVDDISFAEAVVAVGVGIAVDAVAC